MWNNFKSWLSKNKYLTVGYFFVWIVPLILLIVLACESKSKQLSLQLWGASILVIMIIVYFIKLRSWVAKKKAFEMNEQRRIPVPLRILDWFTVMLCLITCILIVNCTSQMLNEVITFIICVCVSETLGYIALALDSYYRKPEWINRVKERDCDK